VISETFALEQVSRAHELSEAGHVRGKLVLRVD
jgi:NADPH:quinone reductase-like Zn-dependent oxidoreductase